MLIMILPLAIGIAIIVLTVMKGEHGLLKIFMLTTGASLAGFAVFAFLHNVVYGLFIHFFGANFWSGGDEPFFFILAVIVCPLGVIVGAIGSIVIAIKRLLARNS